MIEQSKGDADIKVKIIKINAGNAKTTNVSYRKQLVEFTGKTFHEGHV